MATVPNKDPKPLRTKIHIKRDPSEPQGYDWHFHDSGGKHRQKYENDCQPGFLIDFEITNDGGTRLLFPRATNDAMWVHPVDSEDGPCPPRNSRWDEFQAVEVSPDGRTLTVRNLNSYCQLFKFSLNFTLNRNVPTPDLVCWDPIGDNRNGMRARLAPAPAVIGGVAIAAGIAGAAVGYLAFAGKSSRD